MSRVGPGMMLAAIGVGVSHLVQSTRAGAEFGLSLSWLIVLIVVLKYPAFRFAVDYATATGRSLVAGYAKIGSVALAWLGLSLLVDMFIATAAVSLVGAGLFISIFGLPLSEPQVAMGIVVLSALVLLNNQYTRAERIIKVLVVAFSILIVFAAIFAVPLLGSGNRSIFAELSFDRSLLVLAIAVTGWMPMPMSGAIFLSAWVCEKRKVRRFQYKQAIGDFQIGYSLTLVLALCFVAIGAAVLFETDYQAPNSASGFATQFLLIFTDVFGRWMYPIIAATALAVIWSTLVALMDVVPRVADHWSGLVTGAPDDAPKRHTHFLAVQVVGVSLILLFLMGGFGAFINFATSISFVAAPAIAYYNLRAITSDDIAAEYQPDRVLVTWSWLSVFVLAGFAISFFVLKVVA